MRTQVWKSVRSTLPLTNWAVAVGAITGLLGGSLHLKESLDLATAVGIAYFLSIAVGSWLAANLYHWLIRGYAVWIASIQARADSILARLPAAPEAHGSLRLSATVRLMSYSFYCTMLGCSGFVSSLLAGILMAQIDGRDSSLHFIAAVVGFTMFSLSVAAQCLYIFRLHRDIASRDIASIERQMEMISIVPQVTGRAAALGVSMTRTERFGLWFVGIGPAHAEQTTV